MAEPTLALKKADYEVELADYMGWGRDLARWTADQTARIKRDIGSALRRFYYPVPPHDWSFLRPFSSLTLLSGASTARLPDDFGGVEGRISVTTSDEEVCTPIVFGNPAFVQRQLDAAPDQTGRPQIASIKPVKAMQPDQGQKFDVLLFPAADQVYILTFQYYMNPSYLLDAVMPYAYGGAEHSETILESCLAIAEERRLDIPDGAGPHGIAFAKRLMASQALDRRKKPQWIGTNRDYSDGVETLYERGHNWAAVTINGTEYT